MPQPSAIPDPVSASPPPVVVVGAGLAGLSCALELSRRSVPCLVLEAADRVGGRVQTDEVEGFRIDRGFQVLLTAYPEVQRCVDLPALRLGAFEAGALVRQAGRFVRLGDPFRQPWDVLATLRSGVATPLDLLRVLRLRARARQGAAEALLRLPSCETISQLRVEGFSPRIIDRFFRPFLGGVLLDRSLRASSRSLLYLFRMFAEGPATLPAGGMQALPLQLASLLPAGSLRTGARVAEVAASHVTLASGERLAARGVVVATEPRAAARLLPALRTPAMQRVATLSFDAPEAPPVGRWLVLDGEGRGPVNELCVPSAVAEGYAPAGRALVSASVLGSALELDDAALEAAVRRQLREWFGGAIGGWRLLRIDRIDEALPFQPPGPLEPAERPSALCEVFVCGDHRDLASIQGAMASGRRAAEAVCARSARRRDAR